MQNEQTWTQFLGRLMRKTKSSLSKLTRRQTLITVSAAIIAGLSLIACGGAEKMPSPETSKSTEPVKAVKAKSAAESVQPEAQAVSAEEALLKRGRIVWFKCRSCHETDVDGLNKVGPSLYGVMEAKAGVKEGFVYSKALAESGIVWNDETLDAFIEKPSTYVKGTKMAFVGIKKESDRTAVIAYIKENTKSSE